MMWTMKRCQQETGLPYFTVRRLCLEGKIKFIRSGNRYYVLSESLLNYLRGEAGE